MLRDRRGLLFDLAATANEPPETKEGQGVVEECLLFSPLERKIRQSGLRGFFDVGTVI